MFYGCNAAYYASRARGRTPPWKSPILTSQHLDVVESSGQVVRARLSTPPEHSTASGHLPAETLPHQELVRGNHVDPYPILVDRAFLVVRDNDETIRSVEALRQLHEVVNLPLIRTGLENVRNLNGDAVIQQEEVVVDRTAKEAAIPTIGAYPHCKDADTPQLMALLSRLGTHSLRLVSYAQGIVTRRPPWRNLRTCV